MGHLSLKEPLNKDEFWEEVCIETGDRTEDAGRRAMPVHVHYTNCDAGLTSHIRTRFWTVS